ncbi:hypothetical protein U472_00300 [Orenia metallireducens]|jgi:hypothetical protein|uniref:Uncharacterized protein n=1 Tax=Orenia metallireducens TaxID=1413210 RepID=A0A1C0ADD3_9FIRM|nr:hypothetical protein [Orenia metallireducens]OCL28632.1 hypothetical protein U472_00300 [Orenia metallireducens]
MVKRPRLQELDTNIKAALQADPELLEFYNSLTDEQKANSYISLNNDTLSPEAIRDVIKFIKRVEEGKNIGIKLDLSNVKSRDDFEKELDRIVTVGNQENLHN